MSALEFRVLAAGALANIATLVVHLTVGGYPALVAAALAVAVGLGRHPGGAG